MFLSNQTNSFREKNTWGGDGGDFGHNVNQYETIGGRQEILDGPSDSAAASSAAFAAADAVNGNRYGCHCLRNTTINKSQSKFLFIFWIYFAF